MVNASICWLNNVSVVTACTLNVLTEKLNYIHVNNKQIVLIVSLNIHSGFLDQ